jgi:acetyl-CoA C-acetyltransferase
MSTGVAIVGVAQTRYEAAKDHLAYNELVYEVVAQLLRETGVKMSDIHSQVTASQDMFDGKTISSMSVNEVVGGYLKSEAKVAADGLQAVLYGAARILSGSFDYTLITAHAKESESRRSAVTVSMFDPFTQRPIGMHDAISSGLQAQRYLHVSGLTAEDLAELSRRRHLEAKKNPLAQRSGDFSIKQIMESPQVAGPLRELMVSPSSDGACAVLLASAEKAIAFGKRAVWISGMGNCTDAYWTERDLAAARALEVAAATAYRVAGITDPTRELDVAEISARCAHEEPLFAHSLRLFDGDARKWMKESGKGEGVVVNPSGGVITGNPTSVAGLARLAEAYLQLSGQAGDHQVTGAGTALAHAADGICGQGHSVVILRANPGN